MFKNFDLPRILGLAKTECGVPPVMTLQQQFTVSEGIIDVLGIKGSASGIPRDKRAIAIATHADGESSNYQNYGLSYLTGGDGPEVKILKASVESKPLAPGAVYPVFKQMNPSADVGGNAIFISAFLADETFWNKVDKASQDQQMALITDLSQRSQLAVRAGVANALRVAELHELKHVDFAVMDGGNVGIMLRAMGPEESAIAMARGMTDYVRDPNFKGNVTATVIQWEHDNPVRCQHFAAAFKGTLEAYRNVCVAPRPQAAATATL